MPRRKKSNPALSRARANVAIAKAELLTLPSTPRSAGVWIDQAASEHEQSRALQAELHARYVGWLIARANAEARLNHARDALEALLRAIGPERRKAKRDQNLQDRVDRARPLLDAAYATRRTRHMGWERLLDAAAVLRAREPQKWRNFRKPSADDAREYVRQIKAKKA
ncbi:hypothetical protein VVD49_15690 [Uliginosibacterium sp. H3]|uniref:Uncharacterized protein n=1 Tax=Uliginosibacterium silvisoli TaxID=3114758 RepID=A0ABU6K6Q3_9RHOO|nr:hypothetical protein [Uliginosibacterium sp. H3]